MKKLAILFGIVGLLLVVPNGYYFWIGVKASDQPVNTVSQQGTEVTNTRPNKGELIGTLNIPSIKLQLPIFHGSSEDELKKGVGHYIKSGLPGENRHIVLTGHRDTVFRKLQDIKTEAYISLKMNDGTYQYKINKIKIVNKYDRTVLVEKPFETLTLITCYPFEYIGNAPERLIISAKLIKKEVE